MLPVRLTRPPRGPRRPRRDARGGPLPVPAPLSVPVRLAAALAVAALTVGVSGCGGPGPTIGRVGRSQAGSSGEQSAVHPPAAVRLLGDGSTSDTGPQPHQPVPYRLVTGETPPQFVVFSFDGAAEDGRTLFSRFRAVGEHSGAAMTYFLSGVSLLPAGRADQYVPPGGGARPADLGAADLQSLADTLRQLRLAWRDGSEIGTAFNAVSGAGPTTGSGSGDGPVAGSGGGADARSCAVGGSGNWTAAEWGSEIRQAEDFVAHWKTNSGLVDEDPLPFDYTRELAGGRAACPGDGSGLLSAEAAAGFRYDASGTGGRQLWPAKTEGLWEFPLPTVPLPGGTREAPATDDGPLGAAPDRRQVHDALVAAFTRAYRGNRAPLFVGAHLTTAGETYLRGVQDTIEDVCARPGVRCVSFEQLADWLDTQDPRVLARLRTLPVGRAPREGWKDFVAAAKR